MITIGYGDITPITTIERIFVILITLLSCGVFAYSLNQIGKNRFFSLVFVNSFSFLLSPIISHLGVLIQVLTQSEN